MFRLSVWYEWKIFSVVVSKQTEQTNIVPHSLCVSFMGRKCGLAACVKSFKVQHIQSSPHDLYRLLLKGFMASSEFVEELLIQGITLVTAAGRHEDVSTNILVDDLAVSVHTAKSDVYVSVKLNGHLMWWRRPTVSTTHQWPLIINIQHYFSCSVLLAVNNLQTVQKGMMTSMLILTMCVFTISITTQISITAQTWLFLNVFFW